MAVSSESSLLLTRRTGLQYSLPLLRLARLRGVGAQRAVPDPRPTSCSGPRWLSGPEEAGNREPKTEKERRHRRLFLHGRVGKNCCDASNRDYEAYEDSARAVSRPRVFPLIAVWSSANGSTPRTTTPLASSAPVRALPQCLHLMASGWISSLQYGYGFFADSRVAHLSR